MSNRATSRLEAFIRGFESESFFIGIDVHKRSYHIALRRVDGLAQVWVSSADPSSLAYRLKELKISIKGIVYEAGPTGYSLARNQGSSSSGYGDRCEQGSATDQCLG